MADDDSSEKSHEPTDKRKQDAREEGQVLTSKEAFVFASLAAGTALLALGHLIGPMLTGRWTEYFRMTHAKDLDALLTSRLSQFWTEILLIGLGFATPIAVILIALQFAMGGINFSTKAASFKISKIDPMRGLARMVSMEALVELGKGILKVGALGGLAILALKGNLNAFSELAELDPAVGLSFVWSAIVSLLAWLCLGLAGIGGLDIAWQTIAMRKKLMMSFQQVKEETKEANGSPEVKGRMRRLQMEASMRSGKQRAALADVPNATAIVTNPTHFAVALRYVPGETRAPVVIAMGKGPIAQEIMAIGRGAAIQVIQSPPLARALYFTSNIGGQIAEALFGPVAALLAHVYRLDRGEYSNLPEITLPDGLRFNEHGRQEQGKRDAQI